MENIGDWLYIIIIIIAGISSIFSSIRKKSRQASTQTQQTEPREIIKDDTFDDDFWGDKSTNQQFPEKEPVSVFQQQPKARLSNQTLPKQNEYSFYKKNNEFQPSVTTNYINSTFADNDEDYSSITLEDLPSNTEEWRKAFIHNEIFNRKY